MQKIELEVIDEFITENFLPSKREAKKKDLVSSLNSAREESDRQSETTCVNCKHRHTEEATNGEDLHLCQNPKIRLWNLTNCDIDITEFGCTYFESKLV